MDIVHVPQGGALDRWSRLQRFFRYEGRFGALRFSARFDIVELTPPGEPPPGRELGPQEGAERP